jgi:hypothetical protein
VFFLVGAWETASCKSIAFSTHENDGRPRETSPVFSLHGAFPTFTSFTAVYEDHLRKGMAFA